MVRVSLHRNLALHVPDDHKSDIDVQLVVHLDVFVMKRGFHLTVDCTLGIPCADKLFHHRVQNCLMVMSRDTSHILLFLLEHRQMAQSYVNRVYHELTGVRAFPPRPVCCITA